MKKNKGITLVALIITIIVMLILVGVSVSILINSDLIGTAQNAGDRTETAYEEEGSMSAITVGNKIYANIDDYIAGKEMIQYRTIYEGTEPTTDGSIVISDTETFKQYYNYRITLESDAYTGVIEATAIDVQGMYALCCIDNRKIEIFNSVKNAMDTIGSASSDVVLVGGINMTGVGSSINFVSNSSTDNTYTVTKVEESLTPSEPVAGTVYEGKIPLNDFPIELPFELSLTRQYRNMYFGRRQHYLLFNFGVIREVSIWKFC